MGAAADAGGEGGGMILTPSQLHALTGRVRPSAQRAACGTLHHRDENAAENIRWQGILKLKAEGLSVSAHGGGVSRVPSAPGTGR